MQPRTSLRIVRPVEEPELAERRIRPFTREEKRELFKRLVVASLDAGFLRYSRRQELLKIATKMGFREFEACLLIAEAQFRSAEIDPAEIGSYEDVHDRPEVSGIKVSTQITLALIVAAFVDLAVICWLF